MDNNDLLRRLRYAFNFSDSGMIDLFQMAGKTTTREEISNWLKRDSEESYTIISDEDFANFLNGMIVANRGKKDGKTPVPEKRLDNNTIVRKLKIALLLTDDQMLDILKLMDMNVSKHELSAFFRNPKQEQYRQCKDQMLRKFVYGLQKKYRPD